MLNTIKDLVKIPSETGKIAEVTKCLNYCKKFFANKKVFMRETESNGVPSLLISNVDTLNLDVLNIGHIDVVPAPKSMYTPIEKDGKLYGRGVVDMKSFVVVGMKVLENVLAENINLKYGILIVSDEEVGGFNGAKHWVEKMGVKAKVALDPDGGNKINTIVYKAKGVLMVRLVSTGEEAHGSRPWEGVDAIENLMQTIRNLRKQFPYYSKTKTPKDEWISTMHVGTIQGGDATNKIAPSAEAKLDFRLTEKLSQKDVLKIIDENLVEGVKCEFIVEGSNVFTDKNNKYLKAYAQCIKNETGENVVFDVAHGASDGRFFAGAGMTLVTHQGTGGGLHAKDEWVEINSLYQLEKIQTQFLRDFHKI